MNIIKKNTTHKTHSTCTQNNYGSRYLLLSICLTMALGYNSMAHCLYGVSRARTNNYNQAQTHAGYNSYAHATPQQNQTTQHAHLYNPGSQSTDNSTNKPSMRIRIKNSIINNMSCLWKTIYGFFWTDSKQNTDAFVPYDQTRQSSYTPSYTQSYAQSYSQSYAPSYAQSYLQQSYAQPNTQFYAQQHSPQQQTSNRRTTRNRSRVPKPATPQQPPLRRPATNRHHRSSHRSPQAPTPITHRLRQYQIQVTNQRLDSSCGLHAAANAQSVQRCISMGHPLTAASVTQHHAPFYAQGAQFVGHINNLIDNDIMRLVYTHFGMNNCCVMSMDNNICYTTYQSAQDIEWGVPDYSGSTFDNNAIRAMITTLKDGGNDAVHFICHINQNTEHWILISLIKERNQYAIAYMDSQNRPLAQRPQAQRYINMLCEHYFTPLLG